MQLSVVSVFILTREYENSQSPICRVCSLSHGMPAKTTPKNDAIRPQLPQKRNDFGLLKTLSFTRSVLSSLSSHFSVEEKVNVKATAK